MDWIKKARKDILESSPESSIYIGSDSVRYKKGYNTDGTDRWFARYASVIIVHQDSSRGGRVSWSSVTLPDYGQLRTRLLTEVQHSIDAFMSIEDVIGDRYLEVHLDVNPSPLHASNVVAREASGWITGMGLNARIKDESWAASTAADYCAKGRMC